MSQREYRCTECFGRFKTPADLDPDQRVCVVCRVLNHKPEDRPPPPLQLPSNACLAAHKLTRERFDAMLAEQGGVCAICQRIPFKFVIDHHHYTGEVRGLLCYGCNSSIGMLGDDPEVLQRAIVYLTERGNYAGRSPRATRAREATKRA